jgi:hypothetical protein
MDPFQKSIEDRLAQTTKDDKKSFVPPFKSFNVPDFNIEGMNGKTVKEGTNSFQTKFAPTFT